MVSIFRKSYSRSEILEAAGNARARGNRRKAIAAYQKVLKEEPCDYEIHGKVAPLLAESQKLTESWASFKAAGQGYLQTGFSEKALSMYIQASRYMPGEIEVWESITRLQMDRGMRADALNTLIKGHRHFRGRSLRHKAIRLLRSAREISPWHFEATFELARLLSRAGEKTEALELLNGLVKRVKGYKLRKIRGAILRLSPTPASFWWWLRAALSGT